MLHTYDILEQYLCFLVALEKYMLEDFLVPLVITCNMASIIHNEDPQLLCVARPTIVPQESMILIGILRNVLTYEDHSKERILSIAWLSFSNDNFFITLEEFIHERASTFRECWIGFEDGLSLVAIWFITNHSHLVMKHPCSTFSLIQITSFCDVIYSSS